MNPIHFTTVLNPNTIQGKTIKDLRGLPIREAQTYLQEKGISYQDATSEEAGIEQPGCFVFLSDTWNAEGKRVVKNYTLMEIISC